MAIAALPVKGSTNWYGWASDIDAAVRVSDTTFTPGQYASLIAGLDYYVDKSTLKLFFKSLGMRSVQKPTKILAVGDSWIEGSGADMTFGNRMIDKLGASLGQRFSPGKFVGQYLPGAWVAPIGAPATYSGSVTQEFNNWGLGLRDTILNPGDITWSISGRYAKIYYLQSPNQGAFDVYVDGVKVDTVDTNGSDNPGAWRLIDMKTDVPHQLRASVTPGLPGARVFGVYYYASDTTIGMIDGGHAGSLTSLFVSTNAANHWAQATVMDPALVVICTGLNTFYNIGITNFEADFRGVLQKAKAACPNASILVTAAAEPNNAASGAGGSSWAQFVAIQKRVSLEQGAGFLDLRTRFPAFASDTIGVWQPDGVHLNTYGQGMAGDLIVGNLIPN